MDEILNQIYKNLYDIQSSIESTKEEFLEANIDVDSFLKIIQSYIDNFSQLKKFKDNTLIKLLDEKLSFIIHHYQYPDDYSTKMKASINFIKKHKDTFFHNQEKNEITSPNFSDSVAPLKTINIQNFYSIKNISLENLEDKKEIYIVGENGDGKTLFLQALTIALVGVSEGKVFDLTKGQSKFSFHVVDNDGFEYSSNTLQSITYNNLLAYGASRNNYCQIKEDTTGYLSLFSGEYDLKSPTKWLQYLDYSEQKENDNVISVEEAKKLLQHLLNSDIEIDIKPNKVTFVEKGSEVSFEQLSAGYRGVITIICDLIARLSEKQKVKKLSDFKGIVLIDEVELHLHPKWQYAFMNKLRETFPLIQFIVTTHSSTVLLGAGMEAVYYHIYKENGIVQISEQKEMKNDFLNDIQSTVFGFDVNDERINNPTNDDKARQKQAKEALSSLIDTIEEEQ